MKYHLWLQSERRAGKSSHAPRHVQMITLQRDAHITKIEILHSDINEVLYIYLFMYFLTHHHCQILCQLCHDLCEPQFINDDDDLLK